MNLHAPPTQTERQPDAVSILGVKVSNPDQQEAFALLTAKLAEKHFTKVAFLNAHSANTAIVDRQFAQILKSFLVLPDGIGVDIAARLLYGKQFKANLNGTDFVPALLASITAPLTVGIVGAVRENGERATADLEKNMPQHRFVYVNDGYLGPDEEPSVLQRIGELQPDILLVAMGVPRQEKWIDQNLNGELCTMPIAVGALLDFLSGAVSRAPPVMRRLRVEWVYRLCLEPSRLWRRYILGNPVFLVRVAMQRLGRFGGRRQS